MKKALSREICIELASFENIRDIRFSLISKTPTVPALRENGNASDFINFSALFGLMFTPSSLIAPVNKNDFRIGSFLLYLPFKRETSSYDLSKPNKYVSRFSLT